MGSIDFGEKEEFCLRIQWTIFPKFPVGETIKVPKNRFSPEIYVGGHLEIRAIEKHVRLEILT